MTDLFAQLEHDPRFARAVDIIRRHDQETTVTEATAAAQPRPRTVSQFLHSSLLRAQAARADVERHLGGLEAVLHHALPLLERITSDPVLDEFVEAALRASDAGVGADVFEAFTASLRAAAAKKTATAPATAPGAPESAQGGPDGSPAPAAPENPGESLPGASTAVPANGGPDASGDAK